MNNRINSPRFTFQLDAARRRHLSMLRPAAWLLLSLCVSAPASAQSVRSDGAQSHSERAVVVAAATDTGARFTAASGGVAEMRLEVFSSAGERVFDSDFRRGSVLDWVAGGGVTGAQSAPQDDDYLFVVTLRDLSGRLRQSRGVASLRAGRLETAQPGAGASALSAAQAEALALSRRSQVIEEGVEDDALILSGGDASSLAVTAHDGQVGQLTSTTGALTLRTGDLLSGKDVERMRITPEGRVGVGTDKPQAALDVAGDIRSSGTLRAARGVEFADGTVLTSATGPARRTGPNGTPQPLAAGTGTTNRLAKWVETGGAGTLSDSAITEVGGQVGIGTSTPSGQLHVYGAATADVFAGMGTDLINGPAMSYGYAGSSFGRGAGFFNVRPDALAAAPNPSLRFMTVNQERMIITNAGNIGIGTTTPTVKLDVTGDIKASGSLTGATGSVTGNLTVDTTTLHVDAANNRVGVGTTTPTVALDVVGEINASLYYKLGGARVLHNSGVQSISVGIGAGAFSTGSDNAFVGYSAGLVNTTGYQNSFFGSNTGKSNTTGNMNSFVGSNAGTANTTGGSNAFFGSNAGVANTTGGSNSFVGKNAGAANMTGSSNSFFGS